MDETKVWTKLLEHDERFENIESKLDKIESGLNHLVTTTDKIVRMVEQNEAEVKVAHHRIDENSLNILKLQQSTSQV